MELINREDHQKLYLQLYEILKKKIESGEWQVGTQIPTEEDLCNMFSVSRATVRTAVLELVRHGYLKRQQGKGTFIYRNTISNGISMLTNFRESMLEEAANLTTNVLARTVMMPIDELDVKLNIPPDKHVIYIKRLQLKDNEPLIIQESFIPYHICPLLLEEDIARNSLIDIIEKKYGIRITKVRNLIDIGYLNADEARIFGLPEATASLIMMQLYYSGDTTFIYTRSVKKPGRFNFLIELERKAI
ncbi:TPA: GntR family transcriptional regulator [bacterium]|nr:GntR family transcriptional regulator [bacterium]